MASPERPREQTPEQDQPAYVRVARFSGPVPAWQAYARAHSAIIEADVSTLAVWRAEFHRQSLVAVVGEPPPRQIEDELDRILIVGQPASLPAEALAVLKKLHDQALDHGEEATAPP